MYKKEMRVVIFCALASLIIIAAVTATQLTGYVPQEGFTCGEYALTIPQKASASSDAGADYAAAKAIDNNVSTHWIGDSASGYPKWLALDLGEVRCINAVDIYVISLYLPLSMDVQVSDDAQNWRTVETNWEVTQGNAYTTRPFGEQRARYLRLYQTAGPQTSGTATEARIRSAPLVAAAPVAPETALTCEDSDGGLKFETRGMTKLFNDTFSSSFEDSCFSSQGLFEYSCQNNTIVLNATLCPNGCKDGACLAGTVPTTAAPNAAAQEKEKAPAATITSIVPTAAPEERCGEPELLTPRNAEAVNQFHNYRAANAIDNDPDTHWFGDPTSSYPKWISFDLGNKRCLSAVELNIFVWDAPLTLDVQSSADGVLWSTAVSGWTIQDGGVFARRNIPSTVARYVRVYEKSGKREYGSLSEIKVESAPYSEKPKAPTTGAAPQIQSANVIGGPEPDKYIEINGQRAFLEIDGKPVDEFLKGR